jgi:hypothetical protein
MDQLIDFSRNTGDAFANVPHIDSCPDNPPAVPLMDGAADASFQSVVYEDFRQGDPKLPGDGIVTTIPQYGDATLTAPYSLRGLTGGFTVSIFSPDLQVQSYYNVSGMEIRASVDRSGIWRT